MSPAMLSMLIRMMLAQAQECLFEKIALPGIRNQFSSLMKMAQEASKVNVSKDTHTHTHLVLKTYRHSVPSLPVDSVGLLVGVK